MAKVSLAHHHQHHHHHHPQSIATQPNPVHPEWSGTCRADRPIKHCHCHTLGTPLSTHACSPPINFVTDDLGSGPDSIILN
ncbi:hypothetical protein PGT21_020240 [Puccinia graminis f. sp. tritici]|uniref:Uncharacterized protein n=1 Tax=Puccinia graminis f. sp. tritici TaxID=56615 RepID=A0A5B0M481_PUCGR|nr:hypothetical protein PGT21_020240 [Puccinia graminis f. sp. tritici]KAA1071083.1 hypothetical protein PGTUg99_011557 [Puccinia graminis f. sp. tritici]